MEQSDMYDKNHKRTGIIKNRGEKLEEQDYIQAAVAIVRSEGYTLVTRRHQSKTEAGKWEFPGGGSRAGEEPLDTMFRELEEETGISAAKEEVRYLTTVYYDRYHLFVGVFLVEKIVKMNELRLQEEEVSQALLVTDEELKIIYSKMAGMDQKVFDEVGQEVWR